MNIYFNIFLLLVSHSVVFYLAYRITLSLCVGVLKDKLKESQSVAESFQSAAKELLRQRDRAQKENAIMTSIFNILNFMENIDPNTGNVTVPADVVDIAGLYFTDLHKVVSEHHKILVESVDKET